MKHDELERHVVEAARDYNEPPETPRDEMWAVIREALPEGGASPHRLRFRPGRPRLVRSLARRLHRWTPWALGLAAATMMVGFGLGRLTQPGPVEQLSAPIGGHGAEVREPASLTVRMAAADHLSEAEALLTLFRTDRSDDHGATARWARDLLATTRVMIDSRAGDDPELAQLLDDLELVLVQIVSAASDPGNQDLVEDGIRERQLLDKLRAVAPPPGVSL